MLNQLLTVAELHRLIDDRTSPLPAQFVELSEARGLILAESLVADSDHPAWNLSAMDGYAIREAALAGNFKLEATTLPGQPAHTSPRLKGALKVFTGSALPEAVKVIMQEDVILEGNEIRVMTLDRAGHVRRRGSSAKRGDILLPQGMQLSPGSLAILSSVGRVTPRVIPRVRVAHLTTGSEIVSPASTPSPGQIRNTNAPLIQALVEESGNLAIAHQHCDESLAAALEITRTPEYEEANLLLISGGSSGGDHDHTAELIESLGFELSCRKVHCRPGKPFLLGFKGNKVAIGLPGNPVSHFVAFHLFVNRVLQRMRGIPSARLMKGTLSSGIVLQKAALETYWPAEWKYTNQGAVVSAKNWLNSGHLTALAGVNALIRLPAEEEPPLAGQTIEFLSCGNPAINPS